MNRLYALIPLLGAAVGYLAWSAAQLARSVRQEVD